MKKLLIAIIRFYQKYLSGLKSGYCPYTPSCSAYAVSAIEKHGAFCGFILMSYRLLRCNPFSHGGYDPVPEHPYVKIKRIIKKTGGKL